MRDHLGFQYHADGWRIGISAATYLRRYFPAFWATNVAQKALTTARLLGAFVAFLELSHRELLTLDIPENTLGLGEYDTEEIPELIDAWIDHGGIIDTLATGGHWIFSPPVMTYGFDMDDLTSSTHPLAMSLFWMLRRSSWSVISVGTPALCRLGLRAVPVVTPMDALADVLTWQPPGTDASLGSILRYVSGTTGNEFADVSPAETEQDMAWWCVEIFDVPARLALQRQRQREARELAGAYRALNAQVQADTGLMRQIGRRITMAVAMVAPEADKSLIHICPLQQTTRLLACVEIRLCV